MPATAQQRLVAAFLVAPHRTRVAYGGRFRVVHAGAQAALYAGPQLLGRNAGRHLDVRLTVPAGTATLLAAVGHACAADWRFHRLVLGPASWDGDEFPALPTRFAWARYRPVPRAARAPIDPLPPTLSLAAARRLPTLAALGAGGAPDAAACPLADVAGYLLGATAARPIAFGLLPGLPPHVVLRSPFGEDEVLPETIGALARALAHGHRPAVERCWVRGRRAAWRRRATADALALVLPGDARPATATGRSD